MPAVAIAFRPQSPIPSMVMDWKRHHPVARERFGLSRLAELSGVDVHKIQRWQFRGAMKVRRVGKGQDRSYRIWDALHVAIIAEMSMLGLPITGKGAGLSLALLGYLQHRIASDGDLSDVGPVSLIPLPEFDDWGVRPAEWVLAGQSCITIGLGNLVNGLIERYQSS